MGIWFYVQEHPKAQPAVVLVLKRLRRRGHSLKSHSTDWKKPGIEPVTPGLQGIGLSPTPRLTSDVPSALSLGRLFQQLTSRISETLMRYTKQLPFLIAVLII